MPATEPKPNTSHFRAGPSTITGRRATLLALVALGVFVASIVISLVVGDRNHSGPPDSIRLTVVAVFTLSGVGALILAVRSLISGERSGFVWAAGAIGLLVTLSMLLDAILAE